ncbi:MAG: site-specific DNA-methyltransferase [Actinomycetota bacterium]|nr:site-specific DNA-methyltransferase [Actinomycetota bacterium]|tara:strand:+ start:174 stop:1709 length:1536 start_codon:yes stop_codon:yes gene_type:complete
MENVKQGAQKGTATTSFGAGRRESHDASAFYKRFKSPVLSKDETVNNVENLGNGCMHGDARDMHHLPDNSVALVVTSPPYFVGKEYELAVNDETQENHIPASYIEYLSMLRDVFAECSRVLEPGGRIAVNVANLGRKPYRSLSSDVIRILQDDLGLLLRGEVVWQKAEGATGSVAWGSFRKAANPVLRDMTERVIIASKGRFDRAQTSNDRESKGLPHESTITTDEFMEATLDVWRIDAESANRVGHPAPFPVELPRRLIDLYTYREDLVLDPFMGSGTTLVAAIRAGRRPVGYDLEREYVDLASTRVEQERERVAEGKLAAWRRRDLAESGSQVQFFTDETALETAEHVLDRANEMGKKATDIAANILESSGFEIVKEKATCRKLGVSFPFLVTDQAEGIQWYVEVSGAFTTARPGMRRADVLWKTLGRAHVLASDPSENPRLLILTSHLPRLGSEGDRALRAVGGSGFFDAIEMFDDEAVDRLTHYAKVAPDRPVPGFWTEQDIANKFA